MDRTLVFAKRNFTEIRRDPLGYIFCIAFPIAMLIIMSLVNQSIPPEASMTIFRIDNLLGGIIVFGHMFLMLFTALTVSQDRYGSFLLRLYATPMKSKNFILGYIFPMVVIGIIQSSISCIAALIIALIEDHPLLFSRLVMAVFGSIPSAVMFIGIGLIFGTMFNKNTAPGLCSVIISLGSFIGGIWFDAEGIGGVLSTVSRCLPFLYTTKSVRSCIQGQYGFTTMGIPMLVTISCAVLFLILGIFVFKTKMRTDLS